MYKNCAKCGRNRDVWEPQPPVDGWSSEEEDNQVLQKANCAEYLNKNKS